MLTAGPIDQNKETTTIDKKNVIGCYTVIGLDRSHDFEMKGLGVPSPDT